MLNLSNSNIILNLNSSSSRYMYIMLNLISSNIILNLDSTQVKLLIIIMIRLLQIIRVKRILFMLKFKFLPIRGQNNNTMHQIMETATINPNEWLLI